MKKTVTKPEQVVNAVRQELNKERQSFNKNLREMRESGVEQNSSIYQEALLKAREADRIVDNIERTLRILECKIPNADIPC